MRWFLGALFVYAAWHKIASPAEFAHILYGYGLFPNWIVNFLAMIIPWMELFCGMGCILGYRPRAAALLMMMLLSGFIVALSINLYRGHVFDCGCFSFGDTGGLAAIRQLLFRDIVYLSLTLGIFVGSRRRRLCIRV